MNFFVVSLPSFDGDIEEFFDLSWPFFDGSIEEEQCKNLCEKLFMEFNKESKVCGECLCGYLIS